MKKEKNDPEMSKSLQNALKKITIDENARNSPMEKFVNVDLVDKKPVKVDHLDKNITLVDWLKKYNIELLDVEGFEPFDIIYKTKRYDLIEPLKYNRDVNHNHLKRLEKSILENPLVSIVTLNEKLKSIDGNHRKTIAERNNLDLYVMIRKGYRESHMRTLNQNILNWDIKSNLASLANSGVETYVRFRKFMKEEFPGLSLLACQKLLSLIPSYKDKKKTFNSGKFEIVNIEKSRKVAAEIMRFKEIGYAQYTQREFVDCIMQFLQSPSYDNNRMIEKMKYVLSLPSRDNVVYYCSSKIQFSQMLENIYNYRCAIRIWLY
jgi:hypothetical protein